MIVTMVVTIVRTPLCWIPTNIIWGPIGVNWAHTYFIWTQADVTWTVQVDFIQAPGVLRPPPPPPPFFLCAVGVSAFVSSQGFLCTDPQHQ